MSFQRGKLSFPLTAEGTYFPWPFSDHTALLHFKAGVCEHIGFTSSLKPGIWVKGPFCSSSYKCSNHGHRSSPTWVWQGTRQVIPRRELQSFLLDVNSSKHRGGRKERGVQNVYVVLFLLFTLGQWFFTSFLAPQTPLRIRWKLCSSRRKWPQSLQRWGFPDVSRRLRNPPSGKQTLLSSPKVG